MTIQEKKMAIIQRLLLTQEESLINAVEKLLKKHKNNFKISEEDIRIAEKRREEMKTGKVKGIPVEQVIRNARKMFPGK